MCLLSNLPAPPRYLALARSKLRRCAQYMTKNALRIWGTLDLLWWKFAILKPQAFRFLTNSRALQKLCRLLGAVSDGLWELVWDFHNSLQNPLECGNPFWRISNNKFLHRTNMFLKDAPHGRLYPFYWKKKTKNQPLSKPIFWRPWCRTHLYGNPKLVLTW